jgi:hypothetical protein
VGTFPTSRGMNFKPSQLVISLLIGVGLVACTNRPRLKPVNQINEPVFHVKPYATLGIGGGQIYKQGGVSGFYYGMPTPERSEAVYVEPVVNWFFPVTKWAGFYLIPTYWNFLLTGDQYRDAELNFLQTRKLHVAVNGGLSGLSYSGRGGWTTQFGSAVLAKYLFDNRIFSEADYQATVYNKFTAIIQNWNVGLGYQWHPKVSVFANYGGTFFRLQENTYTSQNPFDYFDRDIRSEFTLTTPWYLNSKHILTPEFAYGMRNGGGSDGTLFKMGAHYRFVFD